MLWRRGGVACPALDLGTGALPQKVATGNSQAISRRHPTPRILGNYQLWARGGMLAGPLSGGAALPKDQNTVLLRQLRNGIVVITAVHLAIFVVFVIAAATISKEAARYAEYLEGPLSPQNIAETTNHARMIIADVHTITNVLSASVVNITPLPGNVTHIARRMTLDPAVQGALEGLIDTVRMKVQEMDVKAPSDFLRYVMRIDWRRDVGPYVSQTFALAQYAETVVGVVLSALGTKIDKAIGPGWWLGPAPVARKL